MQFCKFFMETVFDRNDLSDFRMVKDVLFVSIFQIWVLKIEALFIEFLEEIHFWLKFIFNEMSFLVEDLANLILDLLKVDRVILAKGLFFFVFFLH